MFSLPKKKKTNLIFLFPLDFFSDHMEINQGIGKSHGPLPFCVTPFLKYTSMEIILIVGNHWLSGLPTKSGCCCDTASDNRSSATATVEQ